MTANDCHYLLKGYKFVGDGVEKDSSWRKGKQIGCGSYSDVYRAQVTVQQHELDIVVKHIRTDTRKSSRYKKAALDEIKALGKLNNLSHERIVKLFGHCIEDFAIYIFMEFMKQSLYDFIEKSGALDQLMVSRFTKQLLEGVQYLRENRIIHRDIKSANILMNDKENIKLADFGVSKMFKTLSQAQTASTGTFRYMAPEMFTGEKYSYPVDVWAVGCVVVEMSTGGELYPNKEEQQINTIMIGPTPSPLNYLKTVLPDETRQFLQPIFQKDPLNRPTAEKLLKKVFVQDYSDEKREFEMLMEPLRECEPFLFDSSDEDLVSISFNDESDETSDFLRPVVVVNPSPPFVYFESISINKESDETSDFLRPELVFSPSIAYSESIIMNNESDEVIEFPSTDISETVLNISTYSDVLHELCISPSLTQ
ncbi:Mitogen-activated protein kinase kinase kinase npk1 [Bulinus truncatus]|nr:Mitogen-activated protein kinase kinase kinase npk1 [Bulinus truncatus]